MVGMSLCEGDAAILTNEIDRGYGKSPACLGCCLIIEAGIVEGDVDQDGLIVASLFGRDRVGEAKLSRYLSARIGEQYTITRELTMELVGIEARQLRNLVADGKLDQIHRGGPILAASLRRYLGL